jgi:two-component system, response regulator PdtaR
MGNSSGDEVDEEKAARKSANVYSIEDIERIKKTYDAMLGVLETRLKMMEEDVLPKPQEGKIHHTVPPNAKISQLERATSDQLYEMFESSLKTSKKFTYQDLSNAWGIFFSNLYLSSWELQTEMQSGIHRLSEDKELVLREFIKMDCANKGPFVLTVIQKGGMIDRTALIMFSDIEDLAKLGKGRTTAIHMLIPACDRLALPFLIEKIGRKILATLFDKDGIPPIFTILSLAYLSEDDFKAIDRVFSHEDLKKIMAENRMGRNAFEVYKEISAAKRSRQAAGLDTGPEAALVTKTDKSQVFVMGGNLPPGSYSFKQVNPGATHMGASVATSVPGTPKQDTARIPDFPKKGEVSIPEIPKQGTASVPDTPKQDTASVPEIPKQGTPSVPEIPKQGTPSVPEIPKKGEVSIPEIPKQGTASVPDTQKKDTSLMIDPHDTPDKKMTVMIVDDDKEIRTLLFRRLRDLGYEKCLIAQTGYDAINLSRETKPHLVFIDTSMPGKVNGFDAANAIKKISNARIIFLSDNADEGTVARAKEVEPDGFLLKPFSDADLRKKLHLLKSK